MPREVCEADELVRILDVDCEDERVGPKVVEVVEGLDEGDALDVRVEFDEELYDLFGSREADAVLVEEEVGADVGSVCDLGIENCKVSDACRCVVSACQRERFGSATSGGRRRD